MGGVTGLLNIPILKDFLKWWFGNNNFKALSYKILNDASKMPLDSAIYKNYYQEINQITPNIPEGKSLDSNSKKKTKRK